MADKDDRAEFSFNCAEAAAAFGMTLGEQFVELMGAIYVVLGEAEKADTLPAKLGMAIGRLEVLTWESPDPHEVQALVEHARRLAEPEPAPDRRRRSGVH